MSDTTDQNVLLTATGLTKTYRMGSQDLHVLQGLDIQVRRGQWLAILGSSGSGKSTLLHVLGGLDRPTKGNVVFDNQAIFSLSGAKLDRYRNRHVGFVFQFYHLLPELNVVENVLIAAMAGKSITGWCSTRAQARDRAEQLLNRLGLSHRLRHQPAKLSGGERQRVAIARALINSPDVLLADEPTGNLDAATGDQILEVLSEFHRAGQAIVMVTHDQRIAQVADQTVVLESGRLAGTPQHA